MALFDQTSRRAGVMRADWVVRPILWFTTASMISVIVHESAHAIVAAMLGFPTTLFQYWVNWDRSQAIDAQQAVVGVAGPVGSLIVGLIVFLVYRARSRTAAGLPLLYLAAISSEMFFGNLMSAGFVGDLSGVSTTLRLPMVARYSMSAVGAIGTALVLYWLGRELRRWIPDGAGRLAGALGVAGLPVLVGTALILLINQPVPAVLNFVPSRISEQAFHVFTVIGVAIGAKPSSEGRSLGLRRADGAIAFATVLIVRLMVLGITVRV